MRPSNLVFAAVGLLSTFATAQLEFNVDDPASIKDATKVVAAGLREWYTGDKPGDVPGNLPDPYYWWLCGAMMNSFIDYWYYTGDDTYNKIVQQAMVHQIGIPRAFMPENQTKTLGNDDQAFWGMAAMSAAENKLPDVEGEMSWLSLAIAVFNTQVPRWNPETCGGGLNWQIFRFNPGFDYKNTISNGCFFNIAARLAKYTGNETYVEWAEKAWDWHTVLVSSAQITTSLMVPVRDKTARKRTTSNGPTTLESTWRVPQPCGTCQKRRVIRNEQADGESAWAALSTVPTSFSNSKEPQTS